MKTIATSPAKGFVVATLKDGSKVAVRKGSSEARRLGVKSRPKDKITAAQMRTLKKADKLKTKIKGLAEDADFAVQTKAARAAANARGRAKCGCK